MLPDCFEIRVSRSHVLEESYQILQEAQIRQRLRMLTFFGCVKPLHVFFICFCSGFLDFVRDALSAQAPRFEFLAPTLSVRYAGSLGLACICSDKRFFGTKNFLRCSCLLVFALPFMLLHHYLFVNVGEDGQDEGGVTQDWNNMFNLKVFTLHQGN